MEVWKFAVVKLCKCCFKHIQAKQALALEIPNNPEEHHTKNKQTKNPKHPELLLEFLKKSQQKVDDQNVFLN